ncbi:MAG: hypothetical protein WCJ01_09995 [Ignavibacteria bacterium]
MYSKFGVLIIFVISSLLLSSCNDDPASAGLVILNDGDLITVNPDSSFVTSISHFKVAPFFSGGNPLLLGRYKNVSSKMLIEFSIALPDTIKTGVLDNSITVSQTWVEMTPAYSAGNKSAQFDFNVYKIISGWPGSNYFTSDSLAKLVTDPAVLKISSTVTDTLYSFGLNALSANNWFKDTTAALAGLYFEPNSNIDKMIGFQNLNNASAGDIMKMIVVFEKPGVYKDTLTFFPSENLHLVTGDIPAIPQDRIVLQGGISLHSRIKFKLPNIPFGSVINSAVLDVTMDPADTLDFGSPSQLSLLAMFATDTTKNSYDSTKTFKLTRTAGGLVFSGDISGIVQRWVLNEANNGVELSILNDIGSVDMIKLLGAESVMRPRLKVIYTAKKP